MGGTTKLGRPTLEDRRGVGPRAGFALHNRGRLERLGVHPGAGERRAAASTSIVARLSSIRRAFIDGREHLPGPGRALPDEAVARRLVSALRVLRGLGNWG